MKKVVSLLLTAAILAVTLVACSGSKNNKNAEDTEIILGNTFQNIENGGLICTYNDWIFYSDMDDNGCLCAYNNADGNNWKLTDFPVANINVIDNLLVFTGIEDSYFVRNENDTMILEGVTDYSSLPDFLDQCEVGENPVLGGSYYAISGIENFFKNPETAEFSSINITSKSSGFFSPVLFEGCIMFQTILNSENETSSISTSSRSINLKPISSKTVSNVTSLFGSLFSDEEPTHKETRISKENGSYFINIVKVNEDGNLTEAPLYSKEIGKTDWADLSSSAIGINNHGYTVVEANGYIYMQNRNLNGSSANIAIFKASDFYKNNGTPIKPTEIIQGAWNLMSVDGKVYFSKIDGNNIYRLPSNTPTIPTLCNEIPYIPHKQNKDGSWDYFYETATSEQRYRLSKNSEGYWRWQRYTSYNPSFVFSNFEDAPFMELPSAQQHENDVLKAGVVHEIILNEDQYYSENMWTDDDIQKMIKDAEKEWAKTSTTTTAPAEIPVEKDPLVRDAILRGDISNMIIEGYITSYEFYKASEDKFSSFNDILTESRTFNNETAFLFKFHDFVPETNDDGSFYYNARFMKYGILPSFKELEIAKSVPQTLFFGNAGYRYFVPLGYNDPSDGEYEIDFSFDTGTFKFTYTDTSSNGETSHDDYVLQFYMDGDKLKATGEGTYYVDDLFEVHYTLSSVEESIYVS